MAAIRQQLAPLWSQLEQQRGLPAGFLDRMARVESSYNPNAQNPRSSAGGLFQFINSTARQYGLEDKMDPVAASDAAARLAADNAAFLRKAGIEPNARNLYLAHQQGPAGAVKLLSNADAPAESIVGGAAARLNGGAGLTAGQMAEKWGSKFADLGGSGSTSAFAVPSTRPAEGADMNIADMPAVGATPASGQSAFAVPKAGPDGESGGLDWDALMMGMALLANAVPNGQPAKDIGSIMSPFLQAQAKKDDRKYSRYRDERDFSLRKDEIGRSQSNADRAFQLQQEANRRADEASRRAEATAGKTDLIKNYEFDMKALEAEGKPRIPFGSWRENWAKNSQPQTTINNITGGTPELRKSLDKKEGEAWAAAREAGTNSAAAVQDLDILNELSTIAPQGPLTGRLAQAFPGLSDAGAAFQSVISRVAPTLRAPGSGATSDIEYEGMLKSLPSLANRPEANAAIIGAMRSKANLNIQRGEIISEYMNGKLQEAEARTRLDGLNRQSIMTPELQNLLKGANTGPLDKTPAAGPAATTPPRDALEAEARRRGLLK